MSTTINNLSLCQNCASKSCSDCKTLIASNDVFDQKYDSFLDDFKDYDFQDSDDNSNDLNDPIELKAPTFPNFGLLGLLETLFQFTNKYEVPKPALVNLKPYIPTDCTVFKPKERLINLKPYIPIDCTGLKPKERLIDL